jgi:hypothetical protein
MVLNVQASQRTFVILSFHPWMDPLRWQNHVGWENLELADN